MDYKGEPSPLNWPDINSHFGVLDICAFEKDSTGYYKAWWKNDTTSVYILPNSWNHVSGTVFSEVVVFAVAAYAELAVNGVTLGKVAIQPYGVARFPNVVYTAGNISATSYDSNNATLATTLIRTTGPPASLQLSADAGSSTITADGADVSLIRLEVVDANGARVPNASPNVTWTVISGPGKIIGLANGDPADHVPDKVGDPDLPYGGVWLRAAFNGLARAIVQGTQTPGSILVSASSPGLLSASLTITSTGR